MKKNKLLNIANWVCKIGKVVFVVTAVLATIFVIHWNVNPGFYEHFALQETGMDMQFKVIATDEVASSENGVNLATIPRGVVLFNYLKLVALLAISFFILQQAQRVIHSIRDLSTFRERNITSFRMIGQLLIAMFVVDMFSFWGTGDHFSMNIEFNLGILLGALVAFILAEVFKEGNRLMEESKLTI